MLSVAPGSYKYLINRICYIVIVTIISPTNSAVTLRLIFFLSLDVPEDCNINRPKTELISPAVFLSPKKVLLPSQPR